MSGATGLPTSNRRYPIMLFQTALNVLEQAIPDPAPSAPAEFAAKASTAISWVKWGSLAVVMAVLSGAGFLILSENRGGSGMSGEMKSKLGQVVVVLIVVGSAAQIIQFMS